MRRRQKKQLYVIVCLASLLFIYWLVDWQQRHNDEPVLNVKYNLTTDVLKNPKMFTVVFRIENSTIQYSLFINQKSNVKKKEKIKHFRLRSTNSVDGRLSYSFAGAKTLSICRQPFNILALCPFYF